MTTETKQDDAPFETWAVIELLGHRRIGGHVSSVTLFGAAMCRIDVPKPDGEGTEATFFVNAASIYCLTPCGEAEARAVARANRPQPVSRWEMPPALPDRDEAAGRVTGFDDDDDEYHDDR